MDRAHRLLRRVIVFLLIGAIVNVAVAWVCAAFTDPTIVDGEEWVLELDASEHEWWEVGHVDLFGFTYHVSVREKGPLPWRDYTLPPVSAPHWGDLRQRDPRFLAIDPTDQDGPALQLRDVLGTGWPLRSLWCQLRNDVGAKYGLFESDGPRGAIDIGLEGWHGDDMFTRVLPTRPIWPGFAINTLFYAAILWLLFAAPFALRRRRRAKRGLCPACAYPVGASDVCTECGRPVPLSLAAVARERGQG